MSDHDSVPREAIEAYLRRIEEREKPDAKPDWRLGETAAGFLEPLRAIWGESATAQSRRLGLSPSELGDIERGATPEPEGFRRMLRDAYGLPPEALPRLKDLLATKSVDD